MAMYLSAERICVKFSPGGTEIYKVNTAHQGFVKLLLSMGCTTFQLDTLYI